MYSANLSQPEARGAERSGAVGLYTGLGAAWDVERASARLRYTDQQVRLTV